MSSGFVARDDSSESKRSWGITDLNLPSHFTVSNSQFYIPVGQIRWSFHPHRPRPSDSYSQQEGFRDLPVPGSRARLHADTYEGNLRGNRHRAPRGSATSGQRSKRPGPGSIYSSRISKSKAVVQRLPIFGQSPNFEQCGWVLWAGVEKGEKAQEAESSPSAASTNTTPATAAAEGCGEPSPTHACSRAGCQVETPAREAEGTQPQDPWTGEGSPQCLTYKPWLTINTQTWNHTQFSPCNLY